MIWRGSGRRVYKTQEARNWELLAEVKTRAALGQQHGLADLKAYKGKPVKLEISVSRPSWRGKTKKTCELFVRPDVSNFIKLCEDAVFRTLGLDDSAVVELTVRKIEIDGPERTFVRLIFA